MVDNFETIEWDKSVENIFEPWRQLVTKGKSNLSMFPEWIEIAAKSHGLLSNIRIFTKSHDNSITGVFPYLIRKRRMNGIPLRWLEPAFNISSYHPELVCKRDCHNLFSELLSRTKDLWDVVHIQNISPDGDIAKHLRNLSMTHGNVLLQSPGDSSPYIPLKGSWEEFLSAKTKSFRYRLKRRSKKLEKAGKLEIRWYTDSLSIDELFTDILRIEEGSWKMSVNMSITQNTKEIDYYRKLLPYLANSGKLFANTILLDSTPIAYSLCYNDNGVIGQLKTSFLDSYKHLAPGTVLVNHTIQRAFEIGAREFDFLGNIMPHKLEWTDNTRIHNNYFLFSHRRPVHLLGKAKQIALAIKERMTSTNSSEASSHA